MVTVTLELRKRDPGQDDPDHLGGDSPQLDNSELLAAGGDQGVGAHGSLLPLLPCVELHVVRVLTLVADVFLEYFPPVRRQRKLMRKIGTHRIICNSAICVEGKFELPPISDTSAITWCES